MAPRPKRPPASQSNQVVDRQMQAEESSGLNVFMHPVWPDMQFTQGELFFECTLFLYSVLALFLQYLNIYKTLWWLPKSYWHYSMKFHLINPYFLSCVGLLLGWRVIKCFWNTITELVATIAINRSSFEQSVLTVIEYAIVKTPLMTLIITSFLFSFSRVCNDFPASSVMWMFCPILVYLIVFHSVIWERIRSFKSAFCMWRSKDIEISQVFEKFMEGPSTQLDLDSVLHMCSSNPLQVREEVRIILMDLYLRIRRSAFAGFSTAFLSIALPCFFVPFKTSLGVSLKVLIDEAWEWELGLVVGLTAFSHYITYLMPLNYLDLLTRSAVHLGMWEPIEGPKIGQTGVANWAPSPWTSSVLYHEGETVQTPDGKCYKARSVPYFNSVAADPSRNDHRVFFMMCAFPTYLINCMCIFEGCLILVQFWMLVLTTDWQHIVTLVLLMFANYLRLGKLFKDKVILGRIHEPSPEDIALRVQLTAEQHAANSTQ